MIIIVYLVSSSMEVRLKREIHWNQYHLSPSIIHNDPLVSIGLWNYRWFPYLLLWISSLFFSFSIHSNNSHFEFNRECWINELFAKSQAMVLRFGFQMVFTLINIPSLISENWTEYGTCLFNYDLSVSYFFFLLVLQKALEFVCANTWVDFIKRVWWWCLMPLAIHAIHLLNGRYHIFSVVFSSLIKNWTKY